MELLISQKRDVQPTIKFCRPHYARHIFRLTPRNKHFYVVCDRDRYKKPPKSDQLEWYQKHKPAKEIKLSRYQSIDTKYLWFYVKFEVSLSISFTRKMGSQKSETFPKACRKVITLKKKGGL
jgi:hypothetical protein